MVKKFTWSEIEFKPAKPNQTKPESKPKKKNIVNACCTEWLVKDNQFRVRPPKFLNL